MDRLVLSVEAPQGLAEVSVLGSLPVAEVVPMMLRVFDPAAARGEASAWQLSRPGGHPLPISYSLAECGVRNGERLTLRRAEVILDPGLMAGPPPVAAVFVPEEPLAAAPGGSAAWAAPVVGSAPPAASPVRAVREPAPGQPSAPPPGTAEAGAPGGGAPVDPGLRPPGGVLSTGPWLSAVEPGQPPESASLAWAGSSPPLPVILPAMPAPQPLGDDAARRQAEAVDVPPSPSPAAGAGPPPAPPIPGMAPVLPLRPSAPPTSTPPSPLLMARPAVSREYGRPAEVSPSLAASEAGPARVEAPPRQPSPPNSSVARARQVVPARPPALIERLLAVRDAVLASSPGQLAPRGAPGPGSPEPDELGRSVERSTLERARQAWLTTNYFRRLDQAIAGPQLRRCVTIAVNSPKGGVGKTTISILLGTLLAMLRRDRVVAVDANPDYGTLGRYLVPDHPIYVDQLMEVLEHPALTVPLVERSLGQAAHGLLVLPAPRDPDKMTSVGEESYGRVVRRLQELMGILVLDCGPGLNHPVTRVALSLADQVILVSDAEPATAVVVVEAAQRLNHLGQPALVVVNRVPKRPRLDIDKLAGYLPQPWRLRLIPEDIPTASRVSTGQFGWGDAPASWQQAVRELAVALISEWTAEMAG